MPFKVFELLDRAPRRDEEFHRVPAAAVRLAECAQRHESKFLDRMLHEPRVKTHDMQLALLERSHLLLGDHAAGVRVDHPVDLRVVQDEAVALARDDLDGRERLS